jgi:hypothetical protein
VQRAHVALERDEALLVRPGVRGVRLGRRMFRDGGGLRLAELRVQRVEPLFEPPNAVREVGARARP